MRKTSWIIIVLVLVLLVIVFIYNTGNRTVKGTIIDMKGREDNVSVSLNMNTGYSNELVVTIVKDEAKPPIYIYVDILFEGKSLDMKMLKIEEDNFQNMGTYRYNFDSIKQLESNYRNIVVSVSFDKQTKKIPLDSIEIME